MKARILLVDDEESLRFSFERFLINDGYEAQAVSSFDEAIKLIGKNVYDVIFADILLGDRTGLEILRAVREKNATTQVVMITGYPTVETASEAVRLGAFDYLSKPVSKSSLLHAADMALRHKAVLDENARIRSNMQAIFRSVSDAIISVDNDLVLLEANDRAESLCGISRNDIGKPVSGEAGGCERSCLAIIKRSREENRRIEVFQHRCGTSSGLLVNIVASPLLDSEGVPCGSVATIRDETRLHELERQLQDRRHLGGMVGRSGKMQQLYDLVENLAEVQTTVLITGESGTGKELVAEAIHYAGSSGAKPIVKVNCSALPEHLLESELFGHVKGAFTGAVKDRIGRFQSAMGGTIFLDEIGDLSPSVQVKLLRVLQEKEFERVGESTPIKVDARIIAATNKDLRKKIEQGEFREDLFYRLKVVEVMAPPLRERKDDIPLLVGHFLKKCADKNRRKALRIEPEAENLLLSYNWPGNVRELEHAIEHACIMSRSGSIGPDHLPAELRAGIQVPADQENFERILKTLEKTDGNIAKAARLLGMSRPSLYKRLRTAKHRG
jgi:PAS domain S-box-containing protein